MKKLVLPLLFLLGCDDATMIVVDDAYTDDTRVDAVWWFESLVPNQIAPGGESPAYRTVPGQDFAYMILERGGQVFVARTSLALGVHRGEELHVVVSPETIVGDCATNARLTQAEADFITQRIFPDRFASTIYDAETCKLFTND
jgi:hypothetical protein